MERIRLNLSQNFSFSTTIPIRITDLNYGGHVGNDTFLSIVHEARQQFLNQFNYTELEFAGSSLIIADAAIEFKKELLYGDVVKVSVTATGFDRLGFDLHYLLEVEKNGTTSLAGKAKTGMLCFDYSTKKVVAVPEEAVKKLTN